MKIGFVGAGRMGAPMVGRLVEAGHEVGVLGRSAEKCSAINALGATAYPTPAEVAQDADVAVVCVFTDEQVKQVCLGDADGSGLLAAMSPGTTLVIHTTGSPATAEAIAAAAADRGIGVLDAPVSGGPHDIAAGQVTLFVGGDEDAFARAEPALRCYADPILRIGGIGSGQKMKLVNNTVFAAQIGLAAEAARLGERLGIDEAALLGALRHGSGASRALDNIVRAGSTAAFISAVGEFIGKDVAVVRATAAELGAGLGRLDPLVDAGLGG